MPRDTYDELNSYEPMMYRPSDWEQFNNRQLKDFDYFANQLEELGHIPQVEKIVVMNNEDYLIKKAKIESESDFIKWVGKLEYEDEIDQ